MIEWLLSIGIGEKGERKNKLLTALEKPRTKEQWLHDARHLPGNEIGSRQTIPSSQEGHWRIQRDEMAMGHSE